MKTICQVTIYNPSKIDVEVYWQKVGSMLDEDGNPKYYYLFKLALTILLFPHGNDDPEPLNEVFPSTKRFWKSMATTLMRTHWNQ